MALRRRTSMPESPEDSDEEEEELEEEELEEVLDEPSIYESVSVSPMCSGRKLSTDSIASMEVCCQNHTDGSKMQSP